MKFARGVFWYTHSNFSSALYSTIHRHSSSFLTTNCVAWRSSCITLQRWSRVKYSRENNSKYVDIRTNRAFATLARQIIIKLLHDWRTLQHSNFFEKPSALNFISRRFPSQNLWTKWRYGRNIASTNSPPEMLKRQWTQWFLNPTSTMSQPYLPPCVQTKGS